MHENITLEEYKTIETRFYGELIKLCNRYSDDLSLISILGILDIVRQEIKELDRAARRMMRNEKRLKENKKFM
ncbi:MAG: hypothetical protein DRN05_05985 [Thermoplasmata archaeon]|nr:MAG: hypothetical protein DRN05_05985 [Thermoplasmata archaeon]